MTRAPAVFVRLRGKIPSTPSNLFTGDKRALKAVNRMQCNGVFALDGWHVLVLEEAIRLLMICGDKEQVIARIQAHPLVDKAIDICFRNTGSVDNALNSYIEYPFWMQFTVIRVNSKRVLTLNFGLFFAEDNRWGIGT